MSNTSVEAKYVDPDPTSALFIGSWFAVVGVFGIPLNIFIVIATVKVKEIRAVSSNMFIGSLALSDALFLFGFSLHLLYALTFKETFCKVIGFGVSAFGVLSNCIPPFLALNRYAVVCHQRDKLARILFEAFSWKGTYWMIFFLWTFEIVYHLPFIVLDALGVHPAGACTVRNKSTNALFFRVYYYCGVLGLLSLTYVPLFVFYRKVSAWVKRMSAQLSLSGEAKQTVRETENVLLLTKWVTVIPLMFSSPGLLLVILFEFFPDIVSMGVARCIISLYPLVPLFNAIATLKFTRPYRVAFKKVCERTKLTSTLFSWMIEGRWLHKVDGVSDSHITVVAPQY